MQAPSQPDKTIDIGVILRELDAEIAEAEQREKEATARRVYLEGQRAGVLLVLERSQRPVITEGEA